ncbi:cytochrome P450 2J5-like [Emydura macquarii macquarii]|uniref:cytochrome P450 2J5-like n=1 Tax=Emydura macquarii macquarii TaxID=1129001 RepID=UPI00352AD2E3
MFPVIQVFAAFGVFLCVWHFLKVLRARSRFPPGPAPLPVVGNLGTLGFQIHPETLLKVAGVYGNTYTLWLGQTPVIVLNGFQAVKDALIDHAAEFAERPITPFFRDLVGGPHGIIFANGHTWKQQRRFSLMTLRNLGLGKKSLENSIQGQARWLVETFARERGRPMDPSVPILSSITNVIAAVLFGHCFSTEDNTFQQLIRGCQAMAEFQGTVWPCLYNAFPSLMKHLSPVLIKSLTALIHFHELHGLIKEEIKRHRESWLPEEPRDFTDLYLSQMFKTQEDPTSTFKEHNMIQVITDLFIAGSDSTTITLYWALLYMMAYPDVQERVQKELDTVLGPSRVVQYEDRKSLPYTNAVIHEIQRYSSISAIGVMRGCAKDTTLKGFSVTKGTLIFPNILSVLYDPDEWETPRRFNPCHFLDQDGNFVNREAFLIFSAGHRVCLGEQLARMNLFIIFSSLLQAFTFQLPEGVKEINQELIVGGILQPHPYKTCAIRR